MPNIYFILSTLASSLAILVQELLTCKIVHRLITAAAVEGFQSRSFIDDGCCTCF